MLIRITDGKRLAEPVRFDQPILAKGRLGLFRPDESMEARLIAARDRMGCSPTADWETMPPSPRPLHVASPHNPSVC